MKENSSQKPGRVRPGVLAAVLGVTAITVSGLARSGNETPGGEDMIERGGCISCHRIGEKLIGPSFKDVAAKYRSAPGAATHLFDAVRNGSEDVWSDVPMPETTRQKVSDADLKSIIEFILGL